VTRKSQCICSNNKGWKWEVIRNTPYMVTWRVCHVTVWPSPQPSIIKLCHGRWALWTRPNVVKMVLSFEARVFLVEHLFCCVSEYTEEVKQKFAEMLSECHVPHRITVRQLTDKFGEVVELLTCGIRHATSFNRGQSRLLDTSDRVMKIPKKPIRKLLQHAGISYSSTQRALKKQHYTCIRTR
jgi:hypothetical protein